MFPSRQWLSKSGRLPHAPPSPPSPFRLPPPPPGPPHRPAAPTPSSPPCATPESPAAWSTAPARTTGPPWPNSPRRFPGFVHPAFGLHPWQRRRTAPVDWLESLASFLDRFPAATIGECGLDRWIRQPDIELQKDVFLAQLQLATERRLPVTVHCLKAWGPLLECLENANPPAGFLLHSFGGTPELVRQLAPLGARFSFSGHFLHPRKAAVLDAFRTVPADRLLLETDAPDMLPPAAQITHPLATPDSTPLNHPANLPAIAEALAAHLGTTPDHLARQTTANAHAFFGLAG